MVISDLRVRRLWNTHTTYVEQMLQSSPSPSQSEPRADRRDKNNINNLNDLRGWRWSGPLSTWTHTQAHTQAHAHTCIIIQSVICLFFNLYATLSDRRELEHQTYDIIHLPDTTIYHIYIILYNWCLVWNKFTWPFPCNTEGQRVHMWLTENVKFKGFFRLNLAKLSW